MNLDEQIKHAAGKSKDELLSHKAQLQLMQDITRYRVALNHIVDLTDNYTLISAKNIAESALHP